MELFWAAIFLLAVIGGEIDHKSPSQLFLSLIMFLLPVALTVLMIVELNSTNIQRP